MVMGVPDTAVVMGGGTTVAVVVKTSVAVVRSVTV